MERMERPPGYRSQSSCLSRARMASTRLVSSGVGGLLESPLAMLHKSSRNFLMMRSAHASRSRASTGDVHNSTRKRSSISSIRASPNWSKRDAGFHSSDFNRSRTLRAHASSRVFPVVDGGDAEGFSWPGCRDVVPAASSLFFLVAMARFSLLRSRSHSGGAGYKRSSRIT